MAIKTPNGDFILCKSCSKEINSNSVFCNFCGSKVKADTETNAISLKDYIKRKGKLSFRESINITLLILQELKGAHQIGVIHRMICPNVIYITIEGKVQVREFERYSNLYSGCSESKIEEHTIYSPPEFPKESELNEQSDLFSVGMVLYEMLNGSTPRGSLDLKEGLLKMPKSVEGIILKCLHSNLEDLYGNCQELEVDLRKALQNPEETIVIIDEGAYPDVLDIY